IPDGDEVFRRFTAYVRDALVEGEGLSLGGLGRFTISRRRAFRLGPEGPGRGTRVAVFRNGPQLKARVNGRPAQRAHPVLVPGLEDLPVDDILAVMVDTLADHLSRGLPVRWTGLGELSRSERRGFMGADPTTGATVAVPSIAMVIFRSYPELKEAMNP
ncbi:MAG: HU family DNA-binding protein, partial [Myxococcales bacterium]|nr:HU family DNA-binding protein [Myxococcales bacterium]